MLNMSEDFEYFSDEKILCRCVRPRSCHEWMIEKWLKWFHEHLQSIYKCYLS